MSISVLGVNTSLKMNSGVKRCLFGRDSEAEVKAEQTRINGELDNVVGQKSEQYNFDFRANIPLIGRFQWMCVSPDDLHPFYGRFGESSTTCTTRRPSENNNNESDEDSELLGENRRHDDVIMHHYCTRQSTLKEYYPVQKAKESVRKVKRKNSGAAMSESNKKKRQRLSRN